MKKIDFYVRITIIVETNKKVELFPWTNEGQAVIWIAECICKVSIIREALRKARFSYIGTYLFSKGIIKPNMTKIAKILFEPIIGLGDCVNRHGEPYTIDNKSANLWYKQEADIPSI